MMSSRFSSDSHVGQESLSLFSPPPLPPEIGKPLLSRDKPWGNIYRAEEKATV